MIDMTLSEKPHSHPQIDSHQRFCGSVLYQIHYIRFTVQQRLRRHSSRHRKLTVVDNSDA